MNITVRSKNSFLLNHQNQDYIVERLEIPFREGLELKTFVGEIEVRVSDRGLGEHEAIRLLRAEIERIG